MVAPSAGLCFRRGRCGAGHLYAPAESDAAATLREPKDFLVTVAKRVMVDLFRRRTLERAYLEMLTLIPEGYAPSPEQRQSLLESLQQIDAMLDGLGPKAKQAFLLSQLEGLGYADIAVRLGVSVSSVKKYMAKATEHCLLFSLENDVFFGATPLPRAAPGAEDGHTGMPCCAMSTSPTASAYSGKPGTSSTPITAGPGSASKRCRASCGACRASSATARFYRAGRQSAIDRRTLLKSLLLLLGVGGGGFPYQSPFGRELRADYRTATGEIKPIVLSRRTQLVLNTAKCGGRALTSVTG